MKTFMLKFLNAGLLLIMFVGFMACPFKSKDPTPAAEDAKTLTNPNEISSVMVIPDATIEKGTPPAETNVANAPTFSTTTPEINGISGQEVYINVTYSNAVSNINYIYIQVEGAGSYFKLPIKQSTGKSGTINIPMKVPDNVIVPACKQGSLVMFALMNNGACKQIISPKSPCFTMNLKPRPGKGTANIGGRSYDATAVCDLNFAPYGRGYAIQIGQSQFIIFYNMRQGGLQLGNFETLVDNSPNGAVSSPFALYFDGTTIYSSVSGTASISGKAISTSVVVKDIISGRQINLSATGNCE